MTFYKQLPLPLKTILKRSYSLLPLRVRLGRRFFKLLRFLDETQWWSAAELENYQNEELRKLVRHAYENVPYYHELFKKQKLAPADISTIKDLYKIPVLTKDLIRSNAGSLKAVNFKDSRMLEFSTSGSTGEYLKFYYDRDRHYLNFDPFIWRFFGWAGHTIGELRATFSEWTVSGQIYQYNPVRNLLIFSIYKLNSDTVASYINALQRFNVRYIDGYPSILTLFTSYLKENNIVPSFQLQAIFSHSEILCSWQRRLLETYWGCKCFNWYGLEERVVLGTECEKHEDMHLCSDFGVTEFINGNGDTRQKVIATSLTNYAMPFLRYDTGDVGTISEKHCSCKRGFPLFKLGGGRTRNFASGKDGSSIPIDTVDVPSFIEKVRQFQFVQEQQGGLLLRLVVKSTFASEDIGHIQTELHHKFGTNMDVAIKIVENVERTPSGKTPLFIQKAKKDTSTEVTVGK